MMLVGAFILGVTALMLLAEDERLDEYADRQMINRMADRSRAGWNVRRRRAYTKAGMMK